MVNNGFRLLIIIGVIVLVFLFASGFGNFKSSISTRFTDDDVLMYSTKFGSELKNWNVDEARILKLAKEIKDPDFFKKIELAYQQNHDKTLREELENCLSNTELDEFYTLVGIKNER